MARKVKSDEVVEVAEVENLGMVDKQEFRMNLHELFVVNIVPGVKEVIVKNLGSGDLYANSSEIKYEESDLVKPNSEKVFKNPESVLLYSFSRPAVSIEQYK